MLAELSAHYHSVPILVRRVIDNHEITIVAVFPTLPTVEPGMVNCLTITGGLHTRTTTIFTIGKQASYDYTEDMCRYLRNIGVANLRVYKKHRPWMIREKRLAEVQYYK